MWSNQNTSTLLVEVRNGTPTLENIPVISFKIKYTLTIQSRSCTLVFTQRNWNIMSIQKVAQDVYSSFIHHCQNLKTIKMSAEGVSKLKDSPSMIYYSELKRNELSSHEKIWKKFNSYSQVKEANLTRSHHITWFQPYDILERVNHGDIKKINVCPMPEMRGRMKRWSTEGFRVTRILCMII